MTDVTRKLAAIVSADVAGYSRLMGRDEAGTLQRLKAHRSELIDALIDKHGGRIVKTTGDGLLLEFPSVVAAVECCIAVQKGMVERNEGIDDDDSIRFRIGVHLGDVIVDDDDDIYGDGVNIAARLQEIGEVDGVCISEQVHGHISGRVDASFQEVGEQTLKNIAAPVRVWQWDVTTRLPVSNVDVSQPVAGFDGRPAIAVLSFENMSGDLEQEYFADGIAEDILTRLAMWRWLPVIARNSSFTFKGKNVDVPEVGRALGARYVLEGSVRKAGNRVRITGQLIDADNGHHVWAEHYDGQLDDIFDLQDKITEAVVTALEPAVGKAEMKRAGQLASSDLGAWDTCQRGMWHFNKFTRDEFVVAYDLLQSAVEKKPDFSYALSYMSIIRIFEAMFTWTNDPVDTHRQAHQLAISATNVDPEDPIANMTLGFTLAFQGQHGAGIKTARRAIELNPSYAQAHQALGVILYFDGQIAEGLQEIEQAIRLSPYDTLMSVWQHSLSMVYYLHHDYDRSLEAADEAIRLASHSPQNYRGRALALAQVGRLDDARNAIGTLLELSPNYSIANALPSLRFRREEDLQHMIDGLRKAGLPEQ